MAWKWCRFHHHKVQPTPTPPLLRSSRVMGLHQGPRFPQVCSEWTNEWKVYISKVVESYEAMMMHHGTSIWGKDLQQALARPLEVVYQCIQQVSHTFPLRQGWWASYLSKKLGMSSKFLPHFTIQKKQQQKNIHTKYQRSRCRYEKTTFNWQIEKTNMKLSAENTVAPQVIELCPQRTTRTWYLNDLWHFRPGNPMGSVFQAPKFSYQTLWKRRVNWSKSYS